jgi:hypothetical protein
MTKRSILAGTTPNVVIKAGASVSVKGGDGDQVVAETDDHWGLKVERKKEDIEVQLGSNGTVFVPLASHVKIYAGKNIDVQSIKGQVDGYAGLDLIVHDVHCLGHASAGGRMDVDCQTICDENISFSAGSDLRFHIQSLTNALIRVNDLGGYWEGKIGDGLITVTLKAGGDVTLVTDQDVEALPPNYILGKIEKPNSVTG